MPEESVRKITESLADSPRTDAESRQRLQSSETDSEDPFVQGVYWRDLVEKVPFPYLGRGGDSLVFRISDDKCLGIIFDTSELNEPNILLRAKLFQDLVHALFPDLFPEYYEIHAAAPDSGEFSYWIQEFVEGRPANHEEIIQFLSYLRVKLNRYNIRLTRDPTEENFVVTPDERICCIDLVEEREIIAGEPIFFNPNYEALADDFPAEKLEELKQRIRQIHIHSLGLKVARMLESAAVMDIEPVTIERAQLRTFLTRLVDVTYAQSRMEQHLLPMLHELIDTLSEEELDIIYGYTLITGDKFSGL